MINASFNYCSNCEIGQEFYYSQVNDKRCDNYSFPNINSLSCHFACFNQSNYYSSLESISYLLTQFEKNNFLNEIMSILFNINVSLQFNKRSSTTNYIHISLLPCYNINSTVYEVINNLATDIIPSASLLSFNTSECGISLSSTNQEISSTIPIGPIIGSIIGFIIISFLFVIFGVFGYYYYSSELHLLPNAISWSFLDKLMYPWKWYC